jgi:DNA processing protein
MMNEREAVVALNAVKEIGNRTILKLLNFFGSAVRVFEGGCQEVERCGILPSDALANLKSFNAPEFIEKEFGLMKKHGFEVITMLDEDYPAALKNIADAPAVLYVSGKLPSNLDCSIAVIGSRKCSVYGITAARELSGRFAEAGLCVVSGMARGIDTSAHQGALAVKGKTVAVLGSGLLEIYPQENEGLFKKISEEGAVISEFPLETKPLPYNFPRRNRIISGLSLGVVVVEAARKSGALITADFALEQSKEVYAVPGPIGTLTSSGTNYLIQQGAKLISSAEDVLEDVYGLLKSRNDNVAEVKAQESVPLAVLNLNSEEQTLLELLNQPLHIDEISEKTNLGFGKTASLLLSLELKRCVKQRPGKIYEKSNN